MKKLLFICLVCLLACKKSALKKDIDGTWQLEKSYHGEPPTGSPPTIIYPPGQQIVISKNGNFERWRNDTLVFRGSYSLTKKEDCHPGNSEWIFSTNEPGNTDRYIAETNDQLTLSTPNCYMDGGFWIYKRVAPRN